MAPQLEAVRVAPNSRVSSAIAHSVFHFRSTTSRMVIDSNEV